MFAQFDSSNCVVIPFGIIVHAIVVSMMGRHVQRDVDNNLLGHIWLEQVCSSSEKLGPSPRDDADVGPHKQASSCADRENASGWSTSITTTQLPVQRLARHEGRLCQERVRYFRCHAHRLQASSLWTIFAQSCDLPRCGRDHRERSGVVRTSERRCVLVKVAHQHLRCTGASIALHRLLSLHEHEPWGVRSLHTWHLPSVPLVPALVSGARVIRAPRQHELLRGCQRPF